MVFFPLVFYTTTPEHYYRRPLDALLVVLAVNAFRFEKRTKPKANIFSRRELVFADAVATASASER
jgi:hypothetical protein